MTYVFNQTQNFTVSAPEFPIAVLQKNVDVQITYLSHATVWTENALDCGHWCHCCAGALRNGTTAQMKQESFVSLTLTFSLSHFRLPAYACWAKPNIFYFYLLTSKFLLAQPL